MNRRARRLIRKAARVRRADGRRLGRVLPRIIVHSRACIAAFAALGRAFADITREMSRMTEQAKCCKTCATDVGVCGHFNEGRCAYIDEKTMYPHWTPKAAPQPAPTLAEVDGFIHMDPGFGSLAPGSMTHDMLTCIRALRPLVEAEECKRVVEAAGCMWTQRGQQPWYDHPTADIVVWDRGDPDGAWDSMEDRVATWSEAAASAKRMVDERTSSIAAREEEAAKQAARERIAAAGATLEEPDGWWVVRPAVGPSRAFAKDDAEPGQHYYDRAAAFAEAHRARVEWSEPIEAMDADLLSHTFEAIGGTNWYPDIVQACMAVPRAFLRGWARATGRYNEGTNCVWLGAGPMPKQGGEG